MLDSSSPDTWIAHLVEPWVLGQPKPLMPGVGYSLTCIGMSLYHASTVFAGVLILAAMWQKEGENLARKNGELEGSLRKLRSSLKEGEAERNRLLSRLKQHDELLDAERNRFEKSTAQLNQQVGDSWRHCCTSIPVACF